MTRRAQLLAALLTTSAFGCVLSTPDDDPKTSPYPALTVTGTIVDVRGSAPIEGVHVLVWNEFDTGGAYTDVDGNFTLIVDGSDSASYLRISDPGYRPYETTMTVNATSHDAGTRAIMSKDEVLFSTFGGTSSDVYMIRVGGDGSLIDIATTTDNEISPCRSESGLTVRWANASTRQVDEAAWDGSGATDVWTAPDTLGILGISWSPRATFVETSDGTVVMAEEPSGIGSNFNYDWGGIEPDASPAAFGYFGPQPIEGNMLAFAKGDGIYTAFPYFQSSFLVPEKISSTTTGDDFPAWSPFRSDGTLDLAFRASGTGAIYTTRVSASGHDNVWSPAALLASGGGSDPRYTDIAWAPEEIGADDRLVAAVLSGGTTAFGYGDLVVLSWNHATKTLTGGPTLLYDASTAGSGSAARVAWR